MTDTSCVVCDRISDTNKLEPRFGYFTCTKHEVVPPAWIDVARRQYAKKGVTDWDPKVE